MGGDGGSIPKRQELVKTRGKTEIIDRAQWLYAKWFLCALSKVPLTAPIVADRLGNLYNKEALIRYLLDKSAYGDGDVIAGHIRSLKDVVSLNVASNPIYQEGASHQLNPKNCSKFVCPVTLKEMNGKLRFSFLQTCGCVFSDQALKKVRETSCPTCGMLYSTTDIIPLNGTEDEVQELKKLFFSEKRKKRKRLDGDCKKDNKERKSISHTILSSAYVQKLAGVNAAIEIKKKSNVVQSLYATKQLDTGKLADDYMLRTFNRYAA